MHSYVPLHACRGYRALFTTRLFVSEIVLFDGLLSFLQDNLAICKKTRGPHLVRPDARDQEQPICSSYQTRLHFGRSTHAAVAKPLLLTPWGLHLQPFPSHGVIEFLAHSRAYSWPVPHQFPLIRLVVLSARWSIHHARHHKSSISGFTRILSLFCIDELDAGESIGEFKPSAPLDPAVLHRSLDIMKLQVNGCECSDVKCPPLLINAFAGSIAPGCLQSLRTRCCSMATISAIGKLLGCGGAELTSLDIEADAPELSEQGNKWKDPLDNHWHRLDLALCPKLESLVINIYFRPPCGTSNPSNVPP